MARTRGKKNFMVSKIEEVNYEDTEEGKSSSRLFTPYFSELVMDNLLNLKGSGSLTFDVIPFDINKRCGVDVPMPEKGKKYGKGDTIPVDMSGNLRPGSMGWVLNYGYHEISTNHEEWVAAEKAGDKEAFKKKKAVKFVCPRMYGERCPVCDKYDEARFDWPGKAGCDENKDYAKYVLNPLKVKYRSLTQIDIHKGMDAEENDLKGERRFWDISHKDYSGLLKYANKKEKRYYDDSEDGFTVSVDFENVAVAGAFPEWSLWDFEDRDKELSDEALESAIDLSDAEKVFNIRSYDDIMELLEPPVEKNVPADENEEDGPYSNDEEPPFDVPEKDSVKEENKDEEAKQPKRTRTYAPIEDKKEEEVPPIIQEVMDCIDGEALDDKCSELEIDIYFEDYQEIESEEEQIAKCKADMIKHIKKNIL